MSHMRPEVTGLEWWYKLETDNGTDYVRLVAIGLLPTDVENFKGYCQSEIECVSIVPGYGARMNAPGYMDQTEWSIFDTQDEATEELIDMYDVSRDDIVLL